MAKDRFFGAKTLYKLLDSTLIRDVYVVMVQRERSKGKANKTDFYCFITKQTPSDESVLQIIKTYEADDRPYKPEIDFTTELKCKSRFDKLVETLAHPNIILN